MDTVESLTDPDKQHNVYSVAYNQAGTMVAAGDIGGGTYLWNLGTHTITGTLTDPGDNAAYALAFSPDGATLATGNEGGTVYLWHLARPQPRPGRQRRWHPVPGRVHLPADAVRRRHGRARDHDRRPLRAGLLRYP